MTAKRIAGYGRVNPDELIEFSWDGQTLTGLSGDTLASALLANNQTVLSRSFKYHRPRGLMSAGVEESGAIVSTGSGDRLEANVRATTQELYSGLQASGQNAWPSVRFDLSEVSNLLARFFGAGFYYKTFMGPAHWLPAFARTARSAGAGTRAWMFCEKWIRRAAGMGAASALPDPDHYEQAHAFCDLLVVGAGPAGLNAAASAAEAGADVLLVEQDFELGGYLLSSGDKAHASELAVLLKRIEQAGVRVMRRTTAFGLYDHGVAGLFERVTDHQPVSASVDAHCIPRHRCWTVRCQHTVLATGAIERTMAFADNDRPGIMTAGAAQTYLNRFAVRCAQRVVVVCNNDSAYEVALQLAIAGAGVTLLDARAEIDEVWQQRLQSQGVEYQSAATVLRAVGHNRIRKVQVGLRDVASPQASWRPAETLECEALLVAGGWSPVLHLLSHRGIKPVWCETRACYVPGKHAQPITVLGAANAVFDHKQCTEGATQWATGWSASRAVSTAVPGRLLHGRRPRPQALLDALPNALPVAAKDNSSNNDADTEVDARMASGWQQDLYPLFEIVPSGEGTGGKSFVDPQHDVTVADVQLASREGFVSVEHMKRYTTLGMATDQGKMGNVLGIAVMAAASGRSISEVGTTTFRPPYTPVSLGALRGRSRGAHFRPTRRTPMHDWNLSHGATMMDAGLWQRPWFYAEPGESMLQTADRESATVRRSVGLCDVTSLGKIAVQGPDAAEFLNRVYTNNMASLVIGKARYGVMLRDDGLVLDDGTCWRLAEHDYFVTTTTAQAAAVMVWLEELSQVRWPQLQVHINSVTDQWAGVAVAGPRSRELLALLMDNPDQVNNENLPFMGVTRVETADGLPCRIARISFSGELAYEIYVESDYAPYLIDQLWRGAASMDGCLYGLEALNTLRVEKGHVTGAELDGRVTLQDAGLGVMAAQTKSYIGSTLAARAGLTDTNRPRLVGIMPIDAGDTFNAGSILCQQSDISGYGEGWVTGVASSPELGHWIGLGFVNGGHQAWENRALVAADPVRDRQVAVKVVSPHMVDAEGERLRG